MILRWHNPQNGRHYQAVVGADLFGDSFLWRGWWGANGKRGGEKQDVFTWEGDCLSALHRVIRRRERRGYVLLEDRLPCSDPSESWGGRVGGGCLPFGCVQGETAATQQAPEANAGMLRAVQPLAQVAPGDALGQRP